MRPVNQLSRPSRGLWLPGGTPLIDWSNPLAAGLISNYVASAGEGNVAVRDMVSQARALPVNAPVMKAGAVGMLAAQLSSAVTGFASPAIAAWQKPTNKVSILLFGQTLAAYAGGQSNSNPVYGCRFDNVGSSPWVPWGVFRGSTLASWAADGQLGYSDGTTLTVIDVASLFPSNNAPFCFVCTMDMSAGKLKIYQNGGLFFSNNVTAVNFGYTATSYLCLGCDPLADTPTTNAGLSVASAWNRILSPAEAARLSLDPTAFMLFPRDLLQGSLVGILASLRVPYQPQFQMAPIMAQ